MKYLRKSIYLFSAISIFASCGNPYPQQKTSDSDTLDLSNVKVVNPSIIKVDATLYNQVENIYKKYLQIQNALAADKHLIAAKSTEELSLVLFSYSDTSLPDAQKGIYDNQASLISEDVKKMKGSKNIEQQRTVFSALSIHVFDLLKSFGIDKTVYQVHCSMALNNNGATWLSDKTEISNPYYGSKMLECGEITTIIKK